MPIHGSLDEAPVADVVQLLSLGQKTGCLALTDGTLRGEIYLDEGRVCQATVFNRRDRLGDLLVRSGKITRQQLEEAIAEHRASGVRRVSKILVESGQVARKELEQFVRVGVEEAVYFMFSWRNGSFTFTNNVRPESKDFLVSIDPQGLLLEGARRVDEWSLIKKKIPRFDMVFRIDHARLNGASGNLTDEQKRIVPLIDGSRDCTAIVEMTGLSEFEVGKALFGLITAGFAFLVERRAAQRHLDYQELLAYVVKEARFADAEHRKAAARHIADCATCTARLKSIHVRRTGSTAALPAIETDARATVETAAPSVTTQPVTPPRPPTDKPDVAESPQEPVVPQASTPVTPPPVVQPPEAAEAPPPQHDADWPDVERRVHPDRRMHERRSGGERRRAVSRNWAAGGRVERRSGADRRGAFRRGPERRAWVPAGGGASAVASAPSSGAHAAPHRSLPDRRSTGPRRMPMPDRRSGVSPQPQRVITQERTAATKTPEPIQTQPVPEPAAAKPAAAEPAPERAVAEPISEPTVATPAEESTPATLTSEPAEARPVAEEAQREVVQEAEAAPESDELVTHDLAAEQELLAEDAAPAPAPEASTTPSPEQPVQKRDEELILSAADAMAEDVAEPAADSEVAAEAAADEEDLEPEELEVEPDEAPKAPSKSREFSWLVSPDEADRMVRTSWVELQSPRRSGGRRSSGKAARRAVPERREPRPPKREPTPPPPAVRAPVPTAAAEPAAVPRMQPKPVAPEQPRRPSKRVRWIATAAAAVVLVGAGMLARPLLQRQPTSVSDAVATSAPAQQPTAQQPPAQQPPAQQEPDVGQSAREAQPVASPSREAVQPAAPPPPTRTEAPTRTEPPAARTQPPETPVEKPPPAAAQETPPARATRDSAVQVGPTLPRTVSAPTEPPPAATTTIRGSVRAAGTGAPLAGAVVTIAGKGLTATTDQTGSYIIADVPVGAATVEVTMAGRPAGQQDVVATAGAEATADFSVSAMVTAAQPDDGLGSGEWETADVSAVAEQLGGFIAVIPGLWVESVASPSAGSRRRARVAQLTGSGERIVLTETRSGAPGLGGGTPRVTALRVIGPTEAYPVTTGTASFGSLLVTAKTTLAPDSLRVLLAKLSPLVPSQ